MYKFLVVPFALLIFFQPTIAHAFSFSDIWDSYVLTLASIGNQVAAVNNAFPVDKYIDIKVNGSDGPAGVSEATPATLRWTPRSNLLSRMMQDCRITYPGISGPETKNVESRGVVTVVLKPASDGTSYVELYCKRGTREFRDTVQLVVGTGSSSAGLPARQNSNRAGSSGSGGGAVVPRGSIPTAAPIQVRYRNVQIPGIGNPGIGSPGTGNSGLGNSVVVDPLPSGPSPEEQQIQEQIRGQAQ